jgi:hypothetical protein
MELYNTLIIASNQPDYIKDFQDMIFENEFIVFVVIGTDHISKKIVERADSFADDRPRKVVRKVIWVPNHDLLRSECLELLTTSAGFQANDYEKVLAFVLSPRLHETKDIIWRDETVDDLRIGYAYVRAGKRERNVFNN